MSLKHSCPAQSEGKNGKFAVWTRGRALTPTPSLQWEEEDSFTRYCSVCVKKYSCTYRRCPAGGRKRRRQIARLHAPCEEEEGKKVQLKQTLSLFLPSFCFYPSPFSPPPPFLTSLKNEERQTLRSLPAPVGLTRSRALILFFPSCFALLSCVIKALASCSNLHVLHLC